MPPKSPWLILHAEYDDDPRVLRAGWEAAAIWPRVLCLLKRHDGLVSEEDLEPEGLALRWRMPVELVGAGVAGLRRVGLLAPASRWRRGGPGGRHEVHGWSVPSWDRWQVDADPERSTPFRPERGVNAPVTPPFPSQSSPNGGRTPPLRGRDQGSGIRDQGSGRSRKTTMEGVQGEPMTRSDTPQAGPPAADGGGHLKSPRITEAMSTVWAAYQLRHPRCGATPGHGHALLLARLTRSYSADDLVAVVEWAHDCNSERARYLRDHDYLGLDNLFRQGKVDDRIAWARAWIAAGRPALPIPEPSNGARTRPYRAIIDPRNEQDLLHMVNADLRFHGEAELDRLPPDFNEAAFFSLRRENRRRRKAGLPELTFLPVEHHEEAECHEPA